MYPLRPAPAALALALAALAVGCGDSARPTPAGARGPGVLRLGYFANVTHAPALVGLEQGLFAEELGPEVRLETRSFNAGPETVEAIFSDALDITYVGPNPAINAFAQSQGQAIRIIAGAASGGAALVVQPSITAAEQLRGARLASPQRGNTQDVALRAWLRKQGLSTDLEGGGDVSVLPQPNAQTLETFRSGEIQGAWVPEPWAARLVLEGNGSVLVDERTLWPDGNFVTTHVMVRTGFLEQRPDLVERCLRAHLRALELIEREPARARELVNAGIARVTGKALPAAVIERAWQSLRFTADPIAASLQRGAEDAVAAALLEPISLEGIYDLTLLNSLLAEQGRPRIQL